MCAQQLCYCSETVCIGPVVGTGEQEIGAGTKRLKGLIMEQGAGLIGTPFLLDVDKLEQRG